jgi:CheY-like chemotaxis protein
MDDIDGLSVAKRIREIDDDVPIILVTAFMNYALDGYKVRASIFHTKKEVLLLKAFGSETQSTRIYNLGGQSLRVVPEY